MSKRDEYRRNAALCQRMADQSTDENDRAQWLSVAQSWVGLIRMNEQIAAEAFDGHSRAPSRQEESTVAH